MSSDSSQAPKSRAKSALFRHLRSGKLDWPWLAAACAVVVVWIFFRIYPLVVYPRLLAQNNAQLLVYNSISKTIRQKIDQQPLGDAVARENALRAQIQRTLTQEKWRVDKLIQQTTRELLRRQAAAGPAEWYLMEVDPYFYLSLTDRILDRGFPPFEVSGRDLHIPWMLAPKGDWYPLDLHPLLGAWTHRALSFVWPGLPLVLSVSFLPVLVSLLSLVLFLLVCRKILRVGRAASFLSAIFLGLCPIYLRRTQFGWYDTDAYNVFFPVLLLGAILYLLETSPGAPRTRRWGGLAALVAGSGLYCLFWRGWLLFLTLLALSLSICLLSRIFKKRTAAGAGVAAGTEQAWLLPLLFAGPVLFTLAFFGLGGLRSYAAEAVKLFGDFYLPKISLWPDTFLTVGELEGSGLGPFTRLFGGPALFALALLGPLAESRRADRRLGAFSCGFILIFLILSAALGSHIQRFSILAVGCGALAVALALDFITVRLPQNVSDRFGLTGQWARFLGQLWITLVGVTFIATVAISAHKTVRWEHPIYNRTWDRLMTYLRTDSPKDSIVTSWWSPGHFISAMARRSVTFDGATQNTPQAYWVARFFLSGSEKQALGILRMLDLSGNDATDFLTGPCGFKLSQAVRLLDEILPLTKADAASKLSAVLDPAKTDRLLRMTHGDAKPQTAYILVYDDMIRQAMALQFIGNWRFESAEGLRTKLDKRSARLPSHGSRAYVSLMWALSRRPPIQQEETFQSQGRQQDTLRFLNGIEIDPSVPTARIRSDKLGNGTLKNIYRLDADRLRKIPVGSPTLNASVLYFAQTVPSPDPFTPEGQTYRAVLADDQFLESLACRLYYLKGAGLKGFQMVKAEEDLQTRNKLFLFKVNWDALAAGPEPEASTRGPDR